MDQRYFWPKSAQQYLAPFARRIAPPRVPLAGVPPQAMGTWAGTPARFREAGCVGTDAGQADLSQLENLSEWEQNQLQAYAGTLRYQRQRDGFASIAPLLGAEPHEVDQLDFDAVAGMHEATQAVQAALDRCGVDWTATPYQSFGDLFNRTIGYGEIAPAPDQLYPIVAELVDEYCIDTTGEPVAPPPPPVAIPTATPTIGPGPAPPSSPEDAPRPWGWILAGAGFLTVVGVGIYYSSKGKR